MGLWRVLLVLWNPGWAYQQFGDDNNKKMYASILILLVVQTAVARNLQLIQIDDSISKTAQKQKNGQNTIISSQTFLVNSSGSIPQDKINAGIIIVNSSESVAITQIQQNIHLGPPEANNSNSASSMDPHVSGTGKDTTPLLDNTAQPQQIHLTQINNSTSDVNNKSTVSLVKLPEQTIVVADVHPVETGVEPGSGNTLIKINADQSAKVMEVNNSSIAEKDKISSIASAANQDVNFKKEAINQSQPLQNQSRTAAIVVDSEAINSSQSNVVRVEIVNKTSTGITAPESSISVDLFTDNRSNSSKQPIVSNQPTNTSTDPPKTSQAQKNAPTKLILNSSTTNTTDTNTATLTNSNININNMTVNASANTANSTIMSGATDTHSSTDSSINNTASNIAAIAAANTSISIAVNVRNDGTNADAGNSSNISSIVNGDSNNSRAVVNSTNSNNDSRSNGIVSVKGTEVTVNRSSTSSPNVTNTNISINTSNNTNTNNGTINGTINTNNSSINQTNNSTNTIINTSINTSTSININTSITNNQTVKINSNTIITNVTNNTTINSVSSTNSSSNSSNTNNNTNSSSSSSTNSSSINATKSNSTNNSSSTGVKVTTTPMGTSPLKSAADIVMPFINKSITEPVKLKDDPIAIGVFKFGDRGIADELIPPGRANDAGFRKVKNQSVSFNFDRSLLQLKTIIRASDGSGNNQVNRDFGKSNTPEVRHCPANYADGVGKPITGEPSPREISDVVGVARNKIQLNKENVTLAFTIWGQFIDHDIQFSPANENDTFHIPIPKCDKFLDQDCNGARVIPFSRSIFANGSSPKLPLNALTAWIDASMIYGISQQDEKRLRQFKQGKMRVDDPVSKMLPAGRRVDTSKNDLLKNATSNKNISNITMDAGDSRSNENLILLSYHTIFLREHNRICDIILRNQRGLTDEELFRIARNYVTGLIQKITYDDFLPIVLGPDAYQRFIGDYKGYDQSINPTIEVEFSSAGYRFGHSLLVPSFPLVNLYGDKIQFLRLDNSLFRPDLLNSVSLDRTLRGAARTVTKLRDGEFVDPIRNLLILAPELRNIRMDLLSINIQRGRDHGMPNYNKLRECYGLRKLSGFDEISGEKLKNDQIRQAYRTINDVDSYIGIQAEKGVAGSILGETGIAIVGDQFRRIRDGDRFWYERTFPPRIVQEIKATKLSHIIIRNTAIMEMQEDIFHYNFGGE